MTWHDIADRTPNPRDLLEALPRLSSRRASDEVAMVVSAFGTGLLVGAGLALLFAPTTGRKARRRIAESFKGEEEPHLDS